MLVQRFAFRDVHSLTLGFGPGQRVRIEWSRARVTHKNPAKQLTFSVLPLHVADEIVGTIHRLYPLPRPPPIEEDAQTPRVIREKATAAAAAAAAAARASSRPRLPPPRAQLLNAETETVRLYLLIEVVNLATGRLLPRAAVVSSSTLYVFVESPEYFLVRPTETRRPRRCRFGPTPPSVSQVEPLITAKEKRSKRKDGARLLREEASFRWDALLEVDFLAGDQVAPHAACRPRSGRTHLRKKTPASPRAGGCRAALHLGLDAAALWRRLCAVPLQGARARGFWGAGLGPRGLSRSRAPSRAQRELRALLPEGVTQWQRAFGSATMMAGGAAHGDRDGGDGGNGGGGGDGGDGGGDGGGGDSGGATGDEPAGGDGAEVDT